MQRPFRVLGRQESATVAIFDVTTTPEQSREDRGASLCRPSRDRTPKYKRFVDGEIRLRALDVFQSFVGLKSSDSGSEQPGHSPLKE